MIEIHLKYNNMHIFGMINAIICINNHVISCINSMLSVGFSDETEEKGKYVGNPKSFGQFNDNHFTTRKGNILIYSRD